MSAESCFGNKTFTCKMFVLLTPEKKLSTQEGAKHCIRNILVKKKQPCKKCDTSERLS